MSSPGPSSRSSSGTSSGTSDRAGVSGHGKPFSLPLLTGVFCFLFWAVLFILTDIYVSCPWGFGAREVTALGVFRARLLHADFGGYTFDTGMGMSFYRLLLGGFGGILSFPASLLPVHVHPQVAALLSALRLGSGSAFFCVLFRALKNRSSDGKKAGASSRNALRSSLSAFAMSFFYSAASFLLCLLLRFPVSDTFFLLPAVLLLILRRVHPGKSSTEPDTKAPEVSLSYLIALCACLIGSAAWALIAIPVLASVLLLLLRRKGDGKHTAKNLALSSALALGLCACILLPQFMQIPYALGKGEPAARFLQELGNDTGKYRTDVTFHTEATDILLGTSPSMLVVSPQHTSSEISTDPSAGSTEGASSDIVSSGSFSSQFSYLNEWFHTLWPYLPILPFQETANGQLTYTEPGTVICTVNTLFMDPLFCAVTLPNRSHDTEVLLNENHIADIRRSSGTVLVYLGQYNVGQNLNLKLHSDHPDDLSGASVRFGYLNSLNWSSYTVNSNFGISSLDVDSDGITAEAVAGSEATILTNIQNEPGWALYLNGEKAKLSTYRDAWLCADVPVGSYLIHLHYTAPGSVAGGWISGLSFLLLAALYMLATKKSGRS